MEQITLKPIYHRDRDCIGIYFPKNRSLQALVQKTAGARWSRTHACWYLVFSEANFHKLKNALKDNAIIEASGLRDFLSNKNDLPTKSSKILSAIPQRPHIPSGKELPRLCKENGEALQRFQQLLKLKSYSPSTIRTYTNEFIQYLKTLKNVPAQSMTVQRLKDYLEYCHTTLKLSENTLHSRMNALKFFYEQVLHRQKFFWDIPRPKKPLLLPKLLNENELRRLFNSLENKKHKAMLFAAYSSGLRVSEIVNLKIGDIDSERMQIRVARAKGKKDRYVNLSPVLLDILRKYIATYQPRPKEYLFESEQTLTAYPTRTVQQIFTNARNKAGIRKEVGIHSLRHSFATHLLDKGTDIKYIKDLLGHFNIKTTERYLHVSKERLVNIVSPFDDLWKRQNLEW